MKSILAAAVCSALLSTACNKKPQTAQAAPPDVEVTTVVQKDVPIVREWVAVMDGFVNAQIRAQVSGYVLKQLYTNGSAVAKGAPLFLIDPRPLQAAVAEAQGNLEEAKGKLAQAEGDLQRAEAELGRTENDVKLYTPLAKEKAVSQHELDDAVQNNLAAKAQVEANKANIQAAKASIVAASAALETAKLNLGFTSITSPVNGITAIATAQVGDLVGPQTGALTTVSTMNPILVNFTPSEQEYLAVVNAIGGSPGSVDDAAKKLVFNLQLANGTTYPDTGRLYAINREITVTTGTILVQVEFPNPRSVLRPGGFGKISTVSRIQRGALLVPPRSVSDVQGTYLMALVGSDDKVTIRPVTPGPRAGSMLVIDKGLEPGERFVVEGIQKVKEGLRVNPKPYSPAPEDAKPAA